MTIKIQYYDDSIPFGSGEINFRTFICPDEECNTRMHSRNHTKLHRNLVKHVYEEHIDPFLNGWVAEDYFVTRWINGVDYYRT